MLEALLREDDNARPSILRAPEVGSRSEVMAAPLLRRAEQTLDRQMWMDAPQNKYDPRVRLN